jgi:undecaprenyl diphosphate synthase
LQKNPQHIAIIMDGNRRWATSTGNSSVDGYLQGVEAIKLAVKGAIKNNVSFITFYAFSTENWQRDPSEIDYLKTLLDWYLDNNISYFMDNEIKFLAIGDYSKFGDEIYNKIEDLKERTKNFDKITLIIALNYGGRQEIVYAVNKIIESGINKISETEFSSFLYTKDIPDPDIVIRTGGEKRISNFLIWQCNYSELIFMDKMWPEFKEDDIEIAIQEYLSRNIRKGK